MKFAARIGVYELLLNIHVWIPVMNAFSCRELQIVHVFPVFDQIVI